MTKHTNLERELIFLLEPLVEF